MDNMILKGENYRLHKHTYTHTKPVRVNMQIQQTEDTKSTHRNQLHFYTLIINN